MLKAQVDFPNLVFDKDEIDFGCILNDIEVLRLATMTNNSPLPVQYSWFFLDRPPVIRGLHTDLFDTEVDLESEYESSEDVPCASKETEVEEEVEGEGEGEEEVEVEGEEEEVEVKVEDVKEEKGSEEMDISTGSEGTQNVNMHAGMSNLLTLVSPEGDLVAASTDLHSTDSQFVLQGLKTSLPALSDDMTMKKKKKKKTTQPWERAKDPFMPIPISQVMYSFYFLKLYMLSLVCYFSLSSPSPLPGP